MHHLYRLVLLALCSTALFAAEAPYVSHTVVVRLEGGSPLAANWLEHGRTGQLVPFRALLGDHTTHGYVSSSTLQAVAQAEARRKHDAELQSAVRPLPYIAVIEYTAEIDPAVAARKLATHPDVVYAEPLYRQEQRQFNLWVMLGAQYR